MPIHSEEIYIKVVPAIPVSYKLHKLHTNVHARQSFDIKLNTQMVPNVPIYSAQDTKIKALTILLKFHTNLKMLKVRMKLQHFLSNEKIVQDFMI